MIVLKVLISFVTAALALLTMAVIIRLCHDHLWFLAGIAVATFFFQMAHHQKTGQWFV